MTDRFAAPTVSTEPSEKGFLNPVWPFRILAIAALLSLVLAQTVYKSGNVHDFCLGLPTGLLIGLIVTSFYARGVLFRESRQPSDVEIEKILH